MKISKKNAHSSRSLALTRRTLLACVPVLGLSAWVKAQDATPSIRVRKLHNFEIRVTDPFKSVAFYQDLFGMPK